MPAYNFQDRFVPKILSGDKTHTIRDRRKRRPRAGDTCYLFNRQRTKECRRLGEFPCVKVEDIEIFATRLKIRGLPAAYSYDIWIDGQNLLGDECDAFARRDGFDSLDDMMQFWRGRLPFHGDIIHWMFKP